MNKIAAAICIILGCMLSLSAQVKDSIYSGKVCIIILKNGFEADGIITDVKQDTIWFRDEFGEYKVPKEQIKFVRDINDNTHEVEIAAPVPGSTEACDVYLEAGTLLKDVKLFSHNDSNLTIIKENVEKNIPISKIRKIVFIGSGFGTGALIGAGVGFASGLIVGLTAPHGGHPDYFGQFEGVLVFSVICALPAALIGGVIGALLKTDEKYQLPPGYSITKSKRIRYIMSKHKE